MFWEGYIVCFIFCFLLQNLCFTFNMMKITIMNMWSKWLIDMGAKIWICDNIDKKILIETKKQGNYERIQESFLLL